MYIVRDKDRRTWSNRKQEWIASEFPLYGKLRSVVVEVASLHYTISRDRNRLHKEEKITLKFPL